MPHRFRVVVRRRTRVAPRKHARLLGNTHVSVAVVSFLLSRYASLGAQRAGASRPPAPPYPPPSHAPP